jgi:hypothetical protein
MLFRKKIDPACEYCFFGTRKDDMHIICEKRGEVCPDFKCFWFRYDPCKRIPPKQKALDFEKYNNEDYSL